MPKLSWFVADFDSYWNRANNIKKPQRDVKGLLENGIKSDKLAF